MRPLTAAEHMLFAAIGEYLRLHPTDAATPLKLRIPNVPFDGKPPQPPAVPRGWKLGAILPLHSPALSGPGVTDDIFKDMMEGMGMGALTGGAPASPASGGASPAALEAKKDKKKKAKK